MLEKKNVKYQRIDDIRPILSTKITIIVAITAMFYNKSIGSKK